MPKITLNNMLAGVAVATVLLSAPAFADDKPHFTFIHSAWMGGWQWGPLTQQLQKGADFTTPDLQAHGADNTSPADVALADYVNRIVAEIDKAPKNTILVGHSFGGIVASQVAESRPKKVDAILYVCAFMLPNGVSFMDAVAGVQNSKVLNNLVFSDDKTTVTIKGDALHGAVGHDVDGDSFSAVVPSLVAEPVRPLGEKLQLTEDAYGRVPRYYVECTDDHALPIEQQRKMYETQDVEHVYSLKTSHVPMFSDVENLASILKDVAAREHRR